MKIDYKAKIAIIASGVVFLAVASLYYIDSRSRSKTEVKVDEAQVSQNEVNDQAVEAEQKNNPTETTEVPAPTSEKAEVKEVPKKKAEEPAKSNAGNDSIKIIDRLVDFGFRKSPDRKIDTIIIHSSYDALGENPFSVSGIIDIYESYGVSAHYLIDRDGNIYRLVKDKDIAYHAGVSRVPDGRINVNDFSIGIEIINTKTDKMTDEQYKALNKLLDQLKDQYQIKYVLGHDQIAQGRKTDPWNFEWDRIKE